MNTTTINPVYRKRLRRHRVGITLSVLAMSFGLVALFWGEPLTRQYLNLF